MNVLMVCSGNTCRSPLARAILERLARGRALQVRSAGVTAAEGSPASAEAMRVAERHGLSLAGHRSSPLTAELLEPADFVLAMESHHKRVVERLGAGEKVTLLSEYGGDGRDILDPWGQGEETYEAVFERLQLYLASFLETEQKAKEPSMKG